MNHGVEIEINIGFEAAGIIVFYDFDCDVLNRQRVP